MALLEVVCSYSSSQLTSSIYLVLFSSEHTLVTKIIALFWVYELINSLSKSPDTDLWLRGDRPAQL